MPATKEAGSASVFTLVGSVCNMWDSRDRAVP
jgi:hypothetical protein